MEQRANLTSKLHSILNPFVLRRVKADVMKDLPRKQEIIMYAHMSETQARLSSSLVDKTFVVGATPKMMAKVW